ncbi:hypothetical protein BKA69DRAFT_251409 [Paraphysoderma sedebokerense]|nr:hypothetical protein BKA69DRAFT_251409 [Paraphysoderma sedebokerense]
MVFDKRVIASYRHKAKLLKVALINFITFLFELSCVVCALLVFCLQFCLQSSGFLLDPCSSNSNFVVASWHILCYGLLWRFLLRLCFSSMLSSDLSPSSVASSANSLVAARFAELGRTFTTLPSRQRAQP